MGTLILKESDKTFIDSEFIECKVPLVSLKGGFSASMTVDLGPYFTFYKYGSKLNGPTYLPLPPVAELIVESCSVSTVGNNEILTIKIKEEFINTNFQGKFEIPLILQIKEDNTTIDSDLRKIKVSHFNAAGEIIISWEEFLPNVTGSQSFIWTISPRSYTVNNTVTTPINIFSSSKLFIEGGANPLSPKKVDNWHVFVKYPPQFKVEVNLDTGLYVVFINEEEGSILIGCTKNNTEVDISVLDRIKFSFKDVPEGTYTFPDLKTNCFLFIEDISGYTFEIKPTIDLPSDITVTVKNDEQAKVTVQMPSEVYVPTDAVTDADIAIPYSVENLYNTSTRDQNFSVTLPEGILVTAISFKDAISVNSPIFGKKRGETDFTQIGQGYQFKNSELVDYDVIKVVLKPLEPNSGVGELNTYPNIVSIRSSQFEHVSGRIVFTSSDTQDSTLTFTASTMLLMQESYSSNIRLFASSIIKAISSSPEENQSIIEGELLPANNYVEGSITAIKNPIIHFVEPEGILYKYSEFEFKKYNSAVDGGLIKTTITPAAPNAQGIKVGKVVVEGVYGGSALDSTTFKFKMPFELDKGPITDLSSYKSHFNDILFRYTNFLGIVNPSGTIVRSPDNTVFTNRLGHTSDSVKTVLGISPGYNNLVNIFSDVNNNGFKVDFLIKKFGDSDRVNLPINSGVVHDLKIENLNAPISTLEFLVPVPKTSKSATMLGLNAFKWDMRLVDPLSLFVGNDYDGVYSDVSEERLTKIALQYYTDEAEVYEEDATTFKIIAKNTFIASDDLITIGVPVLVAESDRSLWLNPEKIKADNIIQSKVLLEILDESLKLSSEKLLLYTAPQTGLSLYGWKKLKDINPYSTTYNTEKWVRNEEQDNSCSEEFKPYFSEQIDLPRICSSKEEYVIPKYHTYLDNYSFKIYKDINSKSLSFNTIKYERNPEGDETCTGGAF